MLRRSWFSTDSLDGSNKTWPYVRYLKPSTHRPIILQKRGSIHRSSKQTRRIVLLPVMIVSDREKRRMIRIRRKMCKFAERKVFGTHDHPDLSVSHWLHPKMVQSSFGMKSLRFLLWSSKMFNECIFCPTIISSLKSCYTYDLCVRSLCNRNFQIGLAEWKQWNRFIVNILYFDLNRIANHGNCHIPINGKKAFTEA